MHNSWTILIFMFFGCQVYANVSVAWIGRMGNNLFQYAVAYAVAKENNCKLFAHDNKIKDIFNLDYEIIKNNFFSKIYFTEKNVTNDQAYCREIFNIKDDVALYGFFQTDKYFFRHRKEICNLFSLRNNNVTQNINNYLSSFNKKTIGIHLRVGDYLNMFNDFFALKEDGNFYQKNNDISVPSLMDYDYYVRAIALSLDLFKLNYNDIVFIMVAEEDNKYVDFVIDKIKQHFNGIDIRIYHQDDISDFTLLRQVDACITSASSYSWWAAWLNQKAKFIISPKYWFNYYKYSERSSCPRSYPADIEMSLSNQYFIYSKGFFHAK